MPDFEISEDKLLSLVGELKDQRNKYGELEGEIGELVDFVTILDVMIDRVTQEDCNRRFQNLDTNIVVERQTVDALIFASVLVKQTSRKLFAKYHNLEGENA